MLMACLSAPALDFGAGHDQWSSDRRPLRPARPSGKRAPGLTTRADGSTSSNPPADPSLKRFGNHVLDLSVWPDPLPQEMAVPLVADIE
jgi:hypothetical protein